MQVFVLSIMVSSTKESLGAVMRAPITTIALVATVYVNAVQSVPMLAARPMIWGSATAAYQVEGHR